MEDGDGGKVCCMVVKEIMGTISRTRKLWRRKKRLEVGGVTICGRKESRYRGAFLGWWVEIKER